MPLILKAGGERIYVRGPSGVAFTDIYGVQNASYLRARSEVADLFSFDFPEPCLADGTRYIPDSRDEVFIYKSEADYTNDVRWFGGYITKREDTSLLNSSADGYVAGYKIQASSFDIIMDKELRQTLIANTTWEDLIKRLVAAHFLTQLDQDVSNIVNPNSAPPVKIVNGTMRNLLKAMRSLTGYDFTVDAYKKLHVFKALDVPASFVLEDNPVDSELTSFEELPVITNESRNVFNIVRQPFQNLIGIDDWNGESFTAKGDPKGQGGQLPLLRTPATITEANYIQEKFDGNTIDTSKWTETDVGTTQHVDYPNQGYLFQANGQLQVVGGTGVLGGVGLVSNDFHSYQESSYIVQEFQLTNTTGDGYICLFTDGLGLGSGNYEAGLRVHDNQLKALDGTVLVATLGTTANYILWVTQTAEGWQYDIQGGDYATKQTIRTETGVTHLDEYKLAPIINKSLESSINSFRYRNSDYQIVLEVDGVKKVVGLESSDTDLPDIDAFLNIDETPALIKFKAASALALVASSSDATHFSVQAGQGSDFAPGQRLLIGDDIIEAFDGREAFVASVSGDDIVLVAPGVSGLAGGEQVLVNTTVPAKDAKILVKYAYLKGDEALAADQASIDKYGPIPVTLEEKDHLKSFNDALQEAANYLERFKNGVLKISLRSNSRLIDEPETMTALQVNLTKRPDAIARTLIVKKVNIRPIGDDYRYEIEAESADPVKPLDDIVKGKALVIGSDGVLRLHIITISEEASNSDDITIHAVSSLYIKFGNPEGRRFGEFKLKPTTLGGSFDFSDSDNSQYLVLI